MSAILPGRARNAEATRAAILAAARQRFARDSYDNVGIRDIASDAGVDAALVPRYFGSKEELFRTLLNRPEKVERMVSLYGGSVDSLPERTADLILEEADDEGVIEDFLIMLNSIASPVASTMIREMITERCDNQVIPLLDGDGRDIRARILGSVTVGLILNKMMWGDFYKDPDCRPRTRQRIIELMQLALSPLSQ